ncbi:MAG: DUF3551 domain-containing protein [Rhodopseudomonas sp.]|uniref:DUF3551 domain-containing protein n=1 Tax=Rhodopseudomonas sp. TaxID=1078 RepID=UPI00184C2917|nr:DUF3551 domain-containing protein [Rhodopseudomonas sp.]NVN86340.1 DUF3551 domain-containing protein [Rhodopseudomonas sp.]
MRKMMVSGVAGFGLMVLAGSLAHADSSAPVCLHVYGPVSYDECRYTSIAQCQVSASGRPASCIVNPFYAEPQGRRQRRGALD